MASLTGKQCRNVRTNDISSDAFVLVFFLGWRSCIQRKSSGGIRNQTGTVVKRTRRGSSESWNNPRPGTAICMMIVSYSWKKILDHRLSPFLRKWLWHACSINFFCLIQVYNQNCWVQRCWWHYPSRHYPKLRVDFYCRVILRAYARKDYMTCVN